MTIKQIYNEQGFYGPVPFLTEEKNEIFKKNLDDALVNLDLMNSDYRCKSNVLFPWIDEISRHPVIVDHVSQILGDDFHCWDTLVWVKDKNSSKYVSWHQDATYWNFLPKTEGLTVWYTPSGATKDMGCIEYLVGSHKNKQQEHHDVKNENNLLMRGQTIRQFEKDNVAYAECPAGSFLMHSPYIMHGSSENTTSTPRLAIGFIFASTKAKPIATYSEESTVMISGKDEFNYMVHDPRPTGIWEQDVKTWQIAYDRQHANYYKMEQML